MCNLATEPYETWATDIYTTSYETIEKKDTTDVWLYIWWLIWKLISWFNTLFGYK